MPEELIRRNREWAARIHAGSPGYFSRLAAVQKPEYFWIGCADARVPANVIAGLEPGEVFVHRNVANVVHSSDLNLLSALQFAIEGLDIHKVIVCGHYGCGGVDAACEESSHDHGLVDHWIEPIRRLRHANAASLDVLEDEARRDRLAELNVHQSVARVAETPILGKAWDRGIPIEIHGMIYSLKDGRLTLLESKFKPR
jgi:carbonic anhydrase